MKALNRLHLRVFFVVVVIMIAMSFAVGFDDARHYVIRYDGKEATVNINSADVESILKAARVQLGQHDTYTIDKKKGVVDIIRAKTFTVTDAKGRTTQQYTTQKTVGAALKKLKIDYDRGLLYPHHKTELEEGMHIYLLAPNEKIVLSEEEVPFEIEYHDDASMDFGTEKIGRHGKPGRLAIVAKSIVGSDGKNQMVELERKLIEGAKTQIVRRGIQNAVETPEGWKRYSRKMVAHTTAYTVHCGTGDGITSIGLVARVGIVAVDPNVIPYYTKMYIPGYGLAIAGDCGGSIDGNEVDVFVESYEDAIRWGRRNLEIYILEE